MVTIGEYVLREKDARGLTLDDLFQMTGIRPPHLSRMIKNPPRTPDVDTVEKFAVAFRVQPSDIWKAISEDGPHVPVPLDTLICSRIGRHLEGLTREKQERAIQALERNAQDYAEIMTT